MAIFLSHSRRNSSAALKLYERLVARGVQVWLDMREVDSGADWNRQVADAIAAAEGFVVLLGPEPDSAQRYEWAQITEREIYLDPGKPLVPVVFGSPEIPGFLRTRQVIHALATMPDFDALADQVAQVLGQPEAGIDQGQLQLGIAARELAIENLKRYSLDLEEAEIKRAGLRGLK